VCRELLAIAGDDPIIQLLDLKSMSTACNLKGHLDYTFALAWHPAGNLLASGNQDCTTRLWDMRRPDVCLAVLPAVMGSIRSCRFSADGSCLAAAEPADFVHIYDIAGGLLTRQEIDFFGEISGISFTPGSEALYIGITERGFTSALCYKRFTSR
jgi:WD40 repeat protein